MPRVSRSRSACEQKPFLWIAVHEAAHAIVSFVLDETVQFPGTFLHSITCLPSEDFLATCEMSPRVHCFLQRLSDTPEDLLNERQIAVQHDIVTLLAGPIAEARLRYGSAGSCMLYMDWLPKLVATDTLDAKVDPLSDLIKCQAALRWLGYSDAIGCAKLLWATAGSILYAEWPGILKMARVLRDVGSMDGHDFETHWRRVRPSNAARARRLKGSPIEFWPPRTLTAEELASRPPPRRDMTADFNSYFGLS